jgi:hypothetical protein
LQCLQPGSARGNELPGVCDAAGEQGKALFRFLQAGFGRRALLPGLFKPGLDPTDCLIYLSEIFLCRC